MRGLDQILASSGLNLSSLGSRFGLSPEQTEAALSSLMPAVAGGFQKRADANDLAPVTATANTIGESDTDTGNSILGHIFGEKDVSRQVADNAAGRTGLSSTVMKAMLPVVAAMVAKHFASNSGSGGGGLGGILGSLLGGGSEASSGAGGLGGLFGGNNPLDAILSGLRR